MASRKAPKAPQSVDITDLTQDPKNARRHNARNIGMIEKAIAKVGPARPVLADEDGILLAGNATQQAAINGGITKANIVEADGQTIVAVRVSGLTDEQKTYLALADNRAAELATWDPERIQQLMDEGHAESVNAVFYPKELEELLHIPELAPVPQGDPNWMPRRVAGVKAIDWPQLLFGSYRFELLREVSIRLQDRLKIYQIATGGFEGITSPMIAAFEVERGLRETREDTQEAEQARAGMQMVTEHVDIVTAKGN